MVSQTHRHNVCTYIYIVTCWLIQNIIAFYSLFPTIVALINGSLRMVNTMSIQFGGRLEFYYNNNWGTVCDDGWSIIDAAVACRQMGFRGVSHSDISLFGPGRSSQTIWLDDVACRGSESQLVDCSHAAIGEEDCTHSEDVGIICTNGEV